MFRAGMLAHPRCVATPLGSVAEENKGPQMHEPYSDLVIPTLAQYLGVRAREIAPAHDLYRDWGLTPLSLVVILLDLERIILLELPSHELSEVRTVADLTRKVRTWVRSGAPDFGALAPRRARRSRQALRERRIRRELHFLRWIEQNEKARSTNAVRPRAAARPAAALGAARVSR